MVKIQGATFGDVADRPTRQLGTVYGLEEKTEIASALRLSRSLALLNTPMPWWSYYPWGRVVMLDDFEDTLKWFSLGGTVSKASDAAFVHSGASALKLVTAPTAGQVATAEIIAGTTMGLSSYLSMELYWSLYAAAATTPRDFYVDWWVHDAILQKAPHFGLRYVNYVGPTEHNFLQYWDDTGAWHDIDGGDTTTHITNPFFNLWRIVLEMDPSVGYKYAYVQHNGIIYDLPDIEGEAGSLGIASQPVMVTCTTNANYATTAYVDDFLLMDAVQAHD